MKILIDYAARHTFLFDISKTQATHTYIQREGRDDENTMTSTIEAVGTFYTDRCLPCASYYVS